MKTKLTTTLLVLILVPGFAFAKDDKIDLLVNALVVCPPGAPTRFVDNGDGTICDHQTGLMWEMKNAADGVPNLNNPRDVDNDYTWSDLTDGDGTNPDGTAFTDFLARLNGEVAITVPSEQLGLYRDWRLPTSAEFQTIVDCSFSPCIDPVFGPTAATHYWSSTSAAFGPLIVWTVFFNPGNASFVLKTASFRVRAVRGGR